MTYPSKPCAISSISSNRIPTRSCNITQTSKLKDNHMNTDNITIGRNVTLTLAIIRRIGARQAIIDARVRRKQRAIACVRALLNAINPRRIKP